MAHTHPNHIVKSFDEELGDLSRLLAELGAHVEVMLRDALKALTTSHAALAKDVKQRDAKANAMEVEINNQAMRLIALRQPLAGDLRRIIATTKIAGDLERIGDLSGGLAKRSLGLDAEHATTMTGGLKTMGQQVMRQLAQTLDVFLNLDKDEARRMVALDDETNALYNSLLSEILTHMMEEPRRITSGTHLLFAAKHLERIGDHAVNIAEMTYYVATGKALKVDRPRRKPDAPTDEADI